MRAMRYWLSAHLLRREQLRRASAVSVLEVGVDSGQMLGFCGASIRRQRNGLPEGVNAWDAITLRPAIERLRQLGYGQIFDHDIESEPLPISRKYDVMILLHVLEHLQDPEGAVRRLTRHLRPGGIVIGGFPSVPEVARRLRQARFNRRAGRHGHVSKFSPSRTRQLAASSGLLNEWMSGAFALRCKGSLLESSQSWTRANLAFGAVVPWWPGELYFQFRKVDQG